MDKWPSDFEEKQLRAMRSYEMDERIDHTEYRKSRSQWERYQEWKSKHAASADGMIRKMK